LRSRESYEAAEVYMKARAPISLVAAVDSVDSLTLGSRMEGPRFGW
jgi:hypothetical protein